MKALPCEIIPGSGYVPCSVEKATHITLNIPGPTGRLTLPIILNGKREGTGNWTWNGDTEAPTLRPSVLTTGRDENGKWRCHSWINDGQAQFLADSSHELKASAVPLLDVICESDKHSWKLRNDSFDHEFGTEMIYCEECEHCGETRELEEHHGDDL